MNDESHWICRLMDQVSDPRFYDGVILGACAGIAPFILYLLVTGN